MKKGIIILMLLSSILTVNGQEKVKGSRNVVNVSESLALFNRLKVTDGLEVTLVRSSSPGYDLEMDDNLIEIIDMTIRDSLLIVSLKAKVRSSKKMNITIRFTELSEIYADAKSRILSQSVIETKLFSATITGNSFFQSEVKAKKASILINGSSNLELDFRGDKLAMNASDNAFIKADLDTEKFDLTASGRSDLEIKGNAMESTLTLNDNAQFKARSFDGDAVKVILRENSEATLSVDRDILIDMNDKSTLNLYGEPSITVDLFSGNATLQKMD